MLQHLGFALEDAFARAEKLNMRFPDVCEQTDRRLRHAGDGVDLSEVIRAKLHHGHFMLLAEPQNGGRNTGLIVEIADRGVRGKMLLQYGLYHILCRRLADAAGNADDWDIEPFPVQLCNILIRFDTAFHADMRRIRFDFGQHKRRALFHGLRNETVPVEYFAADRHIQFAGQQGPRVNGRAGDNRIQRKRGRT